MPSAVCDTIPRNSNFLQLREGPDQIIKTAAKWQILVQSHQVVHARLS
jgi:hypothetical protein